MLRLILIFCFVFAVAPVYAQLSGKGFKDSLSLINCITLAKSNNLTIRQVQLTVDANRYNFIQSKANLAPQLNAGFNHTFNYGFNFDPNSLTLKNVNYQTSGINFRLNWVLFNGLSNYYNISQNKWLYKSSQKAFESAVNDLELNVIDIYMQVLFAQERVEIAKKQLKVLDIQKKRSKLFYEAGRTTKGDFLTIQAQYAAQEVALTNANNALTQSKLSLIQIMNVSIPLIDLKIITPDFVDKALAPLPDNTSVTSIYNNALTTQANIISKDFAVTAAKRGISVAKGTRYPTISLSAGYGTVFSELRKENPFDPLSQTVPYFEQFRRNQSQFFGFSVSVPIFTGLQLWNGVKQARLTHKRAQIDLLIEKQQLRNIIQTAYADAQAAYKTYLSSKKNMQAQELAFQYAQSKFKLNAINAYQYNDLQTLFFQAKTELLIAKFDYVFKSKVLDFYNGKQIKFN